MIETKEVIKKEKKNKVAIEVKRIETKHCLKESSLKLKELIKEKEDTQKKLEEKKVDLSFLLMRKEQQSGDEVLKSMITRKKVQISQLNQEVYRVERELTQARDAQLLMASKLVEELSEEIDQIRKDLDERETELSFLLGLQKQSQMNNAELRATIERKQAEIDRLRGHMTDIKSDLSVAEKQHKELCQCLHETTTKLVEQSEQVRGLDKIRAGLERERNQVDTKLKIVIARSEVHCIWILDTHSDK